MGTQVTNVHWLIRIRSRANFSLPVDLSEEVCQVAQNWGRGDANNGLEHDLLQVFERRIVLTIITRIPQNFCPAASKFTLSFHFVLEVDRAGSLSVKFN